MVTQEYEMVAVSKLTPHPRNVNRGDVAAIVESIRRNRFYGAALVQRSTSYILAGKHRWLAAKECQLESIPVIWADVDESEAIRIMLADNRTTRLGADDPEALAALLQELQNDGGLLGTGFDAAALEELLESLGTGDSGPIEGEDDAPEPPAVPISVLGDLWLLGDHRVLCGDSTSRDAVERLMGGAKADMVFTDPPYGVSIVKVKGGSDKGVVGGPKPFGTSGVVGGGSAGSMYPFGGIKKGVVGGGGIVKPKMYAPVMNDETTNTAREFYRTAVEVGIGNFIIFGGNYFTDFLPPSPCWVIWDKQNSGNFSDVEIAWTSFDRGSKLYPFMWNGLARAGDRKTELGTRVHPTQKPVGLFESIFADFPFSICLDGFIGSGSTLIACEKTGRICYGLELSPEYVDIIVRRWQTFTGKQATLDGDGRTFNEIAVERIPAEAAA
jgi:hypothetical protein